ncbi:MAG: helix-turn-helix transcriptional regulator [Gemmatimonadetes bacterium]|nr:helix-turn-helix transcriptional regulator [Gemmatimonadota bacterium]
MKIDSDRLRTLRKRKKLSRPDLARVSGINTRTIQRLENEPDKCKSTREDTVTRLAEALEVEPGVLTGELDLPDSDEAPFAEPGRVRIGAQISPKARLSYDLIKRRYDVNATDIINIAPLLFTLLAEASLAWRQERLEEAREASRQLNQIDGYWRGGLGTGLDDAVYNGIAREEESISSADLFGEHLYEDPGTSLIDRYFFNPEEGNPFADFLHKMADELAIAGIVEIDGGILDAEMDFRFPYYEICGTELDNIAKRSLIGRIALEIGTLRISEIPDDLIADDASEERWMSLEESISEKSGDLGRSELTDFLIKYAELFAYPRGEKIRELYEENQYGTLDTEFENGGDDQ